MEPSVRIALWPEPTEWLTQRPDRYTQSLSLLAKLNLLLAKRGESIDTCLFHLHKVQAALCTANSPLVYSRVISSKVINKLSIDSYLRHRMLTGLMFYLHLKECEIWVNQKEHNPYTKFLFLPE